MRKQQTDRKKEKTIMCFKKNNPKTQPAEELNDISPVSDEKLDSVSGAGNPWEGIEGVPQEQIDEDIRDRV
jgi:hypothetical protein